MFGLFDNPFPLPQYGKSFDLAKPLARRQKKPISYETLIGNMGEWFSSIHYWFPIIDSQNRHVGWTAMTSLGWAARGTGAMHDSVIITMTTKSLPVLE